MMEPRFTWLGVPAFFVGCYGVALAILWIDSRSSAGGMQAIQAQRGAGLAAAYFLLVALFLMMGYVATILAMGSRLRLLPAWPRIVASLFAGAATTGAFVAMAQTVPLDALPIRTPFIVILALFGWPSVAITWLVFRWTLRRGNRESHGAGL
jgi:hypothetical protein